MSASVLYVLGTSGGATYLFAIDPANPTVASAALVATAALTAAVAADLALLKAEHPGWGSAMSSSTWIGGGTGGAYYLIITRLYTGDLSNPYYRVRLVMVGAVACASVCDFAGSADSSVTFPPDPVLFAFDGSVAYVLVPATGPYLNGIYKTAVLILRTDGTSALQDRAYGVSHHSCILAKAGVETLIATEVATEQPI